MNRTFELIKLYPGSPAIGTRVILNGNGQYVDPTPMSLRSKGLFLEDYENYTGFWEEVGASEYTIMSFHDGFNTYVNYGEFFGIHPDRRYTEAELLKKGYAITGVKRNSDGVVFRVGEKVTSKTTKIHTISSFRIVNTTDKTCLMKGMWIQFSSGLTHLKNAIAIPYLFTTLDGVAIYEGDSWWYVAHNRMKGGARMTDTLVYRGTNNSEVSTFSTKEAADKFIAENTKPVPVFRTNDGYDIYEGDKYWAINTANYEHCWENTCKAQTHIQATWRVFKHEAAAREYYLLNKPCLSIKDVASVYSTATQSFQGKRSRQFEGLLSLVRKTLK